MPRAVTDLDAILDKIARLKALEERPGTPEEAAVAAAMIQKLMFKHNLTLAQIDGAQRADRAGYDRHDKDLGVGRSGGWRWRMRLFTTICRTSFCRAVFVDSDHVRATAAVVGEAHNVTVAFGLYDYLVSEIERLCDAAHPLAEREFEAAMRRAFPLRRGPTRLPSDWRTSYRRGAAEGVAAKLSEQFDESRRETADTGALVVVKDAELDAAESLHFPRTRAIATQTVNRRAYEAGVADGRRINLAKQIAGDAPTPALGR